MRVNLKRKLDTLDKQILEYLYEDVRISNRRIAAALGVTEGTVRTRIRRMQADQLVKFTAAVDAKMFAHPVVGFVGVTVVGDSRRSVCEALSALAELNFVAMLLGRYDIICTFLLRDNDQLRVLLQEKIPAIPGVRGTESIQALHVYKFDRRWSVLGV